MKALKFVGFFAILWFLFGLALGAAADAARIPDSDAWTWVFRVLDVIFASYISWQTVTATRINWPYILLAVLVSIWSLVLGIMNFINYGGATLDIINDLHWRSLVLIACPCAWFWFSGAPFYLTSPIHFLAAWKRDEQSYVGLATLFIIPLFLYALFIWVGPYFYPLVGNEKGLEVIRMFPLFGGKGYH